MMDAPMQLRMSMRKRALAGPQKPASVYSWSRKR
jgi:hypothetical protein